VSPLDARTYLVAGTLMVLVAVGTAAIPSLRAAATDPLLAMRAE
jgi:ABC-type antimicrobial peptide transport system permease subunit